MITPDYEHLLLSSLQPRPRYSPSLIYRKRRAGFPAAITSDQRDIARVISIIGLLGNGFPAVRSPCRTSIRFFASLYWGRIFHLELRVARAGIFLADLT